MYRQYWKGVYAAVTELPVSFVSALVASLILANVKARRKATIQCTTNRHLGQWTWPLEKCISPNFLNFISAFTARITIERCNLRYCSQHFSVILISWRKTKTIILASSFPFFFYRAMHFSANARSWDRMSCVCPSVCLWRWWIVIT